jgi:hypothetical protein
MRVPLIFSLLIPQLAIGQNIAEVLPLKWSAEIGNVTYRSTIGMHGTTLFVGSNGKQFNDYYHEGGNGVYALDGRTGQVIRRLGTDAWGDLDVNGVVVEQGRVYFGNDNDEFLCYDAASGALLWRLPTSGDVEHAPTVIRRKGGDRAVVYATEFGEVRAVNPRDGSTVWEHYHPDFDGWKPGKNRFVYRVGAAMRSGNLYFAPPAVVDVDGDGVQDLVYSSTWEHVTVISGQNGRQLRYLDLPTTAFETPHIIESDGGPVLLAFEREWEPKSTTIHRVNLRTGEELTPSKVPYYFNQSITAPNMSDSWTHNTNGVVLRLRAQAPLIQLLPNPAGRAETDPGGFYGRDRMKYRGKEWVAIIEEYDYKTDRSTLSLLDPETWAPTYRFILPAQTESRPHLVDVDGDGEEELLFGSYDGVLYCHEIPQN